uniref:hypothetical protein n=1 Tax=Stylonema alsidii TaxID=35155 RepID=UPI001FCD3292|nr:hypothetical protein MW559_pgp154 [Stylonema alsidii]UNJ15138.1 hypothetical protein [Stylonema alsidii]
MQDTDTQLQNFLHKIDFQNTEINSSQMEIIKSIQEIGTLGVKTLANLLYEHKMNQSISPLDGFIYEELLQIQDKEIQNFLTDNFPSGLIPLQSEKSIDYSYLQKLLQNKNFLEADILTQKKLCELASVDLNTRNWLYFTDISNLPVTDLKTIDTLWRIHSRNRFGFSIQQQIWTNVQGNKDKLFQKIGWIVDNNLCRYPQEFIWDLNAPKGHLPLFNQLRGTQALIYLLSHNAWQSL